MNKLLLALLLALAAQEASCAVRRTRTSSPSPSVAPSPSLIVASVTNFTVSDYDVVVASAPGMIWYGDVSEQDVKILLMPYRLVELNSNESPALRRSPIVLDNQIWLVSDQFDSELEGIPCVGVNMTTLVASNGGVLLASLCVFEDDGVLPARSELEEDWNVTSGSLYFNLEISNWTFCERRDSRCLRRGDILQVDLAINGLMDMIEELTNNTLYLGEDYLLRISPNVEVDNSIESMEEGYPMIMQSEDGVSLFPLSAPNNLTTNLVRLRFPKFEDTAKWDMLIP